MPNWNGDGRQPTDRNQTVPLAPPQPALVDQASRKVLAASYARPGGLLDSHALLSDQKPACVLGTAAVAKKKPFFSSRASPDSSTLFCPALLRVLRHGARLRHLSDSDIRLEGQPTIRVARPCLAFLGILGCCSPLPRGQARIASFPLPEPVGAVRTRRRDQRNELRVVTEADQALKPPGGEPRNPLLVFAARVPFAQPAGRPICQNDL